MLKLVKKEYIAILEWVFKIAYLLLGLATFNAYIYDSSIQPTLVKICLILGMLVLAGRVIYFRDYIKTPYWIVLALFCVSFLLTILVNKRYGQYIADFKWLIWTAMLFFILYICDVKRSRESYKKEFTVLSHIMIVYGSIAAAAGIYLMQDIYQKMWYTASGEKMLAGFSWGRLWGVYTDPNYGAVFSVAVILLCVYFCIRVKSWRKIFYILCASVNYLYMAFSDSRTAEVCMVTAAVFWFLYACVYRFRKKKGVLIGILLSLVFAAVFLGATSYLQSQVNVNVQKEILKKFPPKNQGTVTPGTPAVGRKTDIQKDMSNGRFALWQSGIEIWKTKPVFGTGYNSFLPYVKERLPKTYAVNNTQGEYVSLHNAYLNVLVYQGIVGGVLLLVFAALILKKWYQGLRLNDSEDKNYVAVLTGCVLVIGVSMLFLLEGVYTNSPGSFILWTFLGYLMHSSNCSRVPNGSV